MAYAMVSTVRPKASATPCRPISTLGKAADRTALPHAGSARALVLGWLELELPQGDGSDEAEHLVVDLADVLGQRGGLRRHARLRPRGELHARPRGPGRSFRKDGRERLSAPALALRQRAGSSGTPRGSSP